MEGIQWLLDPSSAVTVASKSGISQARTRLGWEPLHKLHDAVVKPIAVRATRGAWYRGWRLVSLDGSTLDVADEDPDKLSFIHAVRVVRRKLPTYGAIPPSEEESLS
ncbi:MAG TPA: hypothetical protein VKT70_14255 [Stellaceae bacterium]|nr:hypothetical protein [Stellaceae bacterium]